MHISTLSSGHRAFVSNLDSLQVHAPKSIHEALRSPERKNAVWNEICALEKNGTWEITELPLEKQPVGCKWMHHK